MGRAVERRRQRAHIETDQRKLGTSGSWLRGCRKRVRVDDGSFGGVRRRRREVQVLFEDIETWKAEEDV